MTRSYYLFNDTKSLYESGGHSLNTYKFIFCSSKFITNYYDGWMQGTKFINYSCNFHTSFIYITGSTSKVIK